MIKYYLNELHESRTSMISVLQQISPITYKTADSVWSAQQVAYHLYKSEMGIAKIFRSYQRVATPLEAKYTNEQLKTEQEFLTHSLIAQRLKTIRQAPESLSADNIDTTIDVFALLDSSREILMSYIPAIDDDALRGYTFAHPFLGNISLYGWIWFVAQHERRHTIQIQDISYRQLKNQ